MLTLQVKNLDQLVVFLLMSAPPPTQTIQDGVASGESIVEGQYTDSIGDGVASGETEGGQVAAIVQASVSSGETESGSVATVVQDRVGSVEAETGTTTRGVTDRISTGESISGSSAAYVFTDRVASSEVISVSLEGESIADGISSAATIGTAAASIRATDGVPSSESISALGAALRVSDGVPSSEVVAAGFISAVVFITDGVSGDEVVRNGTVRIGPPPQNPLLLLGGDEEADLLGPEEFAALASGTAAWELGYSVKTADASDTLFDDTMAFLMGRMPSVSAPIVLPQPPASTALALRRDADLEAGYVIVPVGTKGANVRAAVTGELAFIYDPRWGLCAAVLADDGRKFLHVGLQAAQGDPRRVESGDVIGIMGSLTREAESAARIAMKLPPAPSFSSEPNELKVGRPYNVEKLLTGSSISLVFMLAGRPELGAAVFIGALIYSRERKN